MRSDFSLNTIRKGKTYDVLSIQRGNRNGTKILGKIDIFKKQKRERTQTGSNCVRLSGRMHNIEKRSTIERRAAASAKKAKRRKLNKTKQR